MGSCQIYADERVFEQLLILSAYKPHRGPSDFEYAKNINVKPKKIMDFCFIYELSFT